MIIMSEVIYKKCPICNNTEFSNDRTYDQHFAELHKDKNSNKFICMECGQECETRKSLILHTTSKCDTLNLHKCNVCEKEFKTGASLHNHTLRHTGQPRFMCRFCAKLFVTMGQLEIHERVHTQDKPFICDVCGKTFRHRQSLVTHSTLHTGIKPFNCENCKRSFSCVGNLIKHRKIHLVCAKTPLTTHTTRNPLTKMKLQANTPKNCKLKHILKEKLREAKQRDGDLTESKLVLNEDLLNRKIRSEGKSSSLSKDPIKFDTEDRRVLSEQLKDEHIFSEECHSTLVNDKETNDNISCNLEVLAENTILCTNNTEKVANDEIKYIDQWQTHDMKESEDIPLKSKGNHSTDIICNTCKKSFETREEYKQHQIKEHPDGLTCHICDKTFATHSSLKMHKKTLHLGIPRKVYRYMCPHCGKQFSQKASLIVHEKNKCNTSSLFHCNICNKSFATTYSQKTHMRVHSNKKFLCNYCGKRFHWKSQLKVHERSHTGDKPFKCLYCPKTFAYRESLITHNSVHTGIKPHLCEACGSRFSCIGNLIKHRITHTSTCGLHHQSLQN